MTVSWVTIAAILVNLGVAVMAVRAARRAAREGAPLEEMRKYAREAVLYAFVVLVLGANILVNGK